MEVKINDVLIVGEAKPSINGEKEGVQIRHGDNEFASGIYWPSAGIISYLLLQLKVFEIHPSYLCFVIMCEQKEGRQRGTWNGKKADNDFYKKIVCFLMYLSMFVTFQLLVIEICA